MKNTTLTTATIISALAFAAVGCSKSKNDESSSRKPSSAGKKVETQVPKSPAPQQPIPVPSTTIQTQGQSQVPINYDLPKGKAVVLPPANGQIQQQVPAGATAQAPQYFQVKTMRLLKLPLNESYTYSSDPNQREELPILTESLNGADGQAVLPGADTRLMGTFYANDPVAGKRSVFHVTGFLVYGKTIYGTQASGFVNTIADLESVGTLSKLLIPTAVGAAGAAIGETYTGDKKVDWRSILIAAASGFTVGTIVDLTTRVNVVRLEPGTIFDVCFGSQKCSAK